MANANVLNRRRYIFFLDSRGSNLEYELKKVNKDKMLVEPWKFNSATIEDLIHEAINYGRMRPFDLIYILGGICNITTKNWNTGEISFDWPNADSLAAHIINIMETQEAKFNKELPASEIMFCPIVGANLEKVLRRNATEEQIVMDSAIYMINDHIHKANFKKIHWFPDMASPVHRKMNGIWKSFYSHLSNDGLHLSQSLKEKWAKKILKTVEKNQS